MSIATNVAEVRARIAEAASRAGRRPEEITLVAVSKTFPASAIREAYAAGIRHFGENRVQEWEGKCVELKNLEATWHLIGHLQSNKARRAAALFHTIDSMDSLTLAQRLEKSLAETAVAGGTSAARLQVLIEVRVAPEFTKSGIAPEDLPALAEAVLSMPHLELRGLMCIPPLLGNPENIRPFFRRLRELRDALRKSLPVLSMGMSHDFDVAIEEGATQIRVGTAIFGERTAR